MRTFYLAHSGSLIKSVRAWELKVQGKYEIDLINPFKSNTFEHVEELIKLNTEKKMFKYLQSLSEETCHQIVDRDLEMIRKCDGIVAIFSSPTVGTAMEIFAASWVFRIPVFIICGKYGAHPWLRSLAVRSGGAVFKTRVEFERYLDKEGLRRK
jgi:hypothetical protein